MRSRRLAARGERGLAVARRAAADATARRAGDGPPGHLSEPERHALELTALGEPLAQPALDQLADAAAIESLEEQGTDRQPHGRTPPAGRVWPIRSTATWSAPASAPGAERMLARALAEAAGGRRQDDTLLLASLRLVGGRREPGPSAGRCQGGSGTSRLRAHRAHGPRRHRKRRGLRGAPPGRRGGAPARAARTGRTGAAGLARDAAVTSERVQVALLRFDHEFFRRGTADVAAIEAAARPGSRPGLARRAPGPPPLPRRVTRGPGRSWTPWAAGAAARDGRRSPHQPARRAR